MSDSDSQHDSDDAATATDVSVDDEMLNYNTSRRGALLGLGSIGLLGLLGLTSQPASAVSTTLEFGGKYTSDPGSNYGLWLQPSSARFGILGFSGESNGRGVVGRATSSTGTTVGVLGRCDSSSDGAAGMQGFNDAASGRTYGFKGRSDSPSGRGALGIATADAGSTIGLEGRADSTSGVAVSGTSTASSGTTYGVQGQVNSPDGYGLYTPDNAKVDEDLYTDDSLRGVIDGNVNFIHGSDRSDGDAGSVIMGHSSNNTAADIPSGVFAVGAAIGGGGFDDGSTTEPNIVIDNYGTVSGGQDNRAGSNDGDPTTAEHATVGGGNSNTASGAEATVGGGSTNVASDLSSTVCGGFNNTASGEEATVGGGAFNTASGEEATISGGVINTASGEEATVGGGFDNTASGNNATIPGGDGNTADGNYSLAAGRQADTNGNDGAFVLGDSSSTAIQAQNADEVRSQVPMYAPAFNTTSTRVKKTDFATVDSQAVLNGVSALSIETWRFEHQDTGRHMGPMAGEFHDHFGLGNDAESIASVDADGVLFAAVQGLSEKLDEKDDRIDELEAKADELRTENGQLRESNEDLEARLAAVEDHLGLNDATNQSAPADD